MKSEKITLTKDLKIGDILIEKGDTIVLEKQMVEASPTPQNVADNLQGISLMSARGVLETMFGKRNVDFDYAGAPHFTINTPQGQMMVVNKKYVEPDEEVVYSGELAIGYI